MAPNRPDKSKAESAKPEVSLDDMLKISRQKKENERFAQSILGKDRRASAPGALGKRGKTIDGLPTLASRVGVQKRNTKSNANLKHEAPFKTRVLPSRPSALKHQVSNDLSSRVGPHPRRAPPPAPMPPATAAPPSQTNISIRGIAGPTTVMASNFAPGTTAADIRSAFEPVGGEMLSCRVKSASPTVIVEMIFADRAGADAVIETFNNQKADGRLLYVYLQAGGAAAAAAAATGGTASAPQTHARDRTSDFSGARNGKNAWVDDSGNSGARAEPDYQDGRYGFEEREEEMEIDLDQPQTGNGSRYESSSRRDDRAGYKPNPSNDSYRDDRRDDRRGDRRDDRRGDGRYDRSQRQDRGLYSDRFPRGGNGGNGGGGGSGAGGSGQSKGWR